jgi:hypothetical protein
MLYYKKVDAIQFKLTDEQKEQIKNRKAVFFEGSPVKHVGGTVYIALLQQGENQVRVCEGQWVVRHGDGLWQIFWPTDFIRHFIKADMEDREFVIANDPFLKKSYNQPTVI